VHLARNYPTEFAHNSSYYFRDSGESSLLKLLNNGKKLLADMAHEGIEEILSVSIVPKIIETLSNVFKISRNAVVRERISFYFTIILDKYSND
jgi:hypothetical protein